MVSASNFTPLANPGPRSSIKVGANINVSNEPGPQSETNIAINPANPKQIVAGSNEIFRLPMRGYFSSDGGANLGDQYGDYGGIDVYGGVAYPFWTDRRVGGSVDGYEEAYTAAITAK